MNSFLPLDEIYIEINGERIGNVEKYSEKISQENIIIESIGEGKPVGNVKGRVRYEIELSKIYIYTMLIGGNENINKISNFELVVGTSNKKTIYYGCEWVEINKKIGSDSYIYENIKISAMRREEV